MTTQCCWCDEETLEQCPGLAVWEIRDLENPNTLENDSYACNDHLVSMLSNNNSVVYLAEGEI